MSQFDVVVATCDKYLAPENITPYIQNILTEDQLVLSALEKKGLKAVRKSWADPDFDWSATDKVLIRTTWDYFDRFDEWQQWLDLVSEKSTLINPVDLVRWNMDKHYLGDLQKRGINIPKTHYIEKGTTTSLKELHAKIGWEETILKPCVSGASRHTYKLNAKNIEAHESVFQSLIRDEAFMLQPFQKNIYKGEISLMVMGGQFTHAVLKIAKPGDFRVQDDFGGSVHDYQPTQAEMDFAEKAVAACSPSPYLARVDIIRDNNDELAIIELEMIEPELWFRLNPKAAEVLADCILT
ncbi:ATP-grasp domain-containing protein [Roseivirga echinicomitans]